MTRQFWIGAILSVLLLVLEMGAHFPGLNLHHYVPAGISVWIQLLFGTPVVLWSGWPLFERAWASLTSCHLNMFTVIELAVGVAYVYSLVATFAPGLFPTALRDESVVAVYYEAAAVITVLVLLGQVLELRARGGHARRGPPRRPAAGPTGGAIRALLNLAPKTARRILDGAQDGPATACRSTM